MFPRFPVSYISVNHPSEADSCGSSGYLRGALKGRCAEELGPLLAHKPDRSTLLVCSHVNVTSARCLFQGQMFHIRLFRRCKHATETIEAAALDHFLGCSPPIKLLSARVNVSNGRENGCPLSTPSTFSSAVSPKRLAAAAARK